MCVIFSVTKHGVRGEYGIDRNCSNTLKMPTDGQQASANAGASERITQLGPSAPLDFDTTNLADSWKRWKNEL